MGQSKDDSQSGTASTQHTSAYDKAFEQHCADWVGFLKRKCYKNCSGFDFPFDNNGLPRPKNYEELKDIMSKTRQDQGGAADIGVAGDSYTKDDVMGDVIKSLQGADQGMVSGKNIRLTNYISLTDGTLAFNQPDLFYGIASTEIPARVRNAIGKYIQGSVKFDAPVVANFFLEAKGPDGKSTVVYRQAFYDGCMGARAIHQMRYYGRNPSEMYDGNAYTITSTYHDEVLRLYCVWPTKRLHAEQMGKTSYHMSILGKYFITTSEEPDKAEEGVTA